MIDKYIILCTGETLKKLAHPDSRRDAFSGFRKDLTRMEGEFRGVETFFGAMYFANT